MHFFILAMSSGLFSNLSAQYDGRTNDSSMIFCSSVVSFTKNDLNFLLRSSNHGDNLRTRNQCIISYGSMTVNTSLTSTPRLSAADSSVSIDSLTCSIAGVFRSKNSKYIAYTSSLIHIVGVNFFSTMYQMNLSGRGKSTSFTNLVKLMNVRKYLDVMKDGPGGGNRFKFRIHV